jgi:hypothetical protein
MLYRGQKLEGSEAAGGPPLAIWWADVKAACMGVGVRLSAFTDSSVKRSALSAQRTRKAASPRSGSC